MVYFTSWDANVFLCLLTYLPEDVVKEMIGCVKKTHEEFSLEEAMEYWVTNSPKLVKSKIKSACPGFTYMFNYSDQEELSEYRKDIWYKRRDNIIEFKREWRLRSIEERKKKVVDWCKFGDDTERLRHQGRLRIINPSDSYSNSYTRNLWATWEAWSHCEHPAQIMSWDTVRPQQWDRRVYVSKWYEGIHPGRFFLFYQKNKIIEERNRGIPNGPCEDGYRYPQTPIFDWGPYEQLIEDLRCLDGSGIGEPVGKKVEHIDDLFS